MNFLRNLLAAILGCLIAFGIVFFMFMIFAALEGSAEGVVVRTNSVLDLDIPSPIQDYTGTGEDDPSAVFY